MTYLHLNIEEFDKFYRIHIVTLIAIFSLSDQVTWITIYFLEKRIIKTLRHKTREMKSSSMNASSSFGLRRIFREQEWEVIRYRCKNSSREIH